MKILFLQDDFPPQSFGGAGISTHELALGMRKIGHEVFVVTTCREANQAGEYHEQNLKIFRIQNSYPEKWRAFVSLYNKPVVRQVEQILQKVRPDVVHANNIHAYLSYYCLKLVKQYAGAVIFTARDTMTFSFGKLETRRYLEHFDYHVTWLDNLKQAKRRWNPFRNIIIKKYLKYADKIVAISEALKKALEQNGINNVSVIYNGIDVKEWLVSREAKEEFRKKYNLQNKKIILFGGRLSASKGGGKALESLARIAGRVPNIILLVAGGLNSYAEIIQKQAKDLGVEDKIIFTGWLDREKMKTAYAISDVVLMPSIYCDVFGRVNIEAMAAKKPIVSTCYGGSPEIVVDGETGFIVNPFDIEELSSRMIELLSDQEKAKKFGEAGYAKAITDFDLSDKVQQYLQLYESLLKARSNKYKL